MVEIERRNKLDELAWGRLDFRKIKLVSFAPDPITPFFHDPKDVDPRIVYIADKNNHCIRRIVVRLSNVDTFAGVCG